MDNYQDIRRELATKINSPGFKQQNEDLLGSGIPLDDLSEDEVSGHVVSQITCTQLIKDYLSLGGGSLLIPKEYPYLLTDDYSKLLCLSQEIVSAIDRILKHRMLEQTKKTVEHLMNHQPFSKSAFSKIREHDLLEPESNLPFLESLNINDEVVIISDSSLPVKRKYQETSGQDRSNVPTISLTTEFYFTPPGGIPTKYRVENFVTCKLTNLLEAFVRTYKTLPFSKTSLENGTFGASLLYLVANKLIETATEISPNTLHYCSKLIQKLLR